MASLAGGAEPPQVSGPPGERDLAVQRALSRVGERRYSLADDRCEHFAGWCATGIAISRQVIAWIGSVIRIAFAVAAAAFVNRPRPDGSRRIDPQSGPNRVDT